MTGIWKVREFMKKCLTFSFRLTFIILYVNTLLMAFKFKQCENVFSANHVMVGHGLKRLHQALLQTPTSQYLELILNFLQKIN